jgi:hypothetical protein
VLILSSTLTLTGADWRMLGLAANGEGQPKHPQDPGQDPGAKQLEGNIQPDADAVEAEAQDGWMLLNA